MTTESFDGVIVVGGGYAGLHAASAVQRANVPVRVVDPSPTHDFITRLASVAGGSAPAHDAAVPFVALGRSVESAVVRRVGDGVVTLDDGRVVEAAAVIIAAGSKPASAPIPGLAHARTLRTAVEASELRADVDGADAVIVVGGGATGVQLAGAISAAHPRIAVTVVERDQRLLAGMAPVLGHHAAHILVQRGVTLRLATNVTEVDDSGAMLDSGLRVDGLVVWAGGFSSAGVTLGENLSTRDGRIEVDPELRVLGWRRTFAAGDVAAHRDRSGRPLPMSAQIAVQAGTGAGQNAARVAKRRTTHQIWMAQRGWVMDLGGGRGVADLDGLTIASSGLDRLAPLLHLAIDAENLVEIGGLGALRWLPGLPRVQHALSVVTDRNEPARLRESAA